MLIEDDAMVRMLVAHHMMDHGWRVTTLKDGMDLDHMMQDEPVDLLLIDLGLPHVDGLSLVEGLRAKGIATPVLIITAYELPHLLATVKGAGANDLLQKPFDEEDLIDRMQRLIAA
jgi:DNA-binding response OmpR family regulator